MSRAVCLYPCTRNSMYEVYFGIQYYNIVLKCLALFFLSSFKVMFSFLFNKMTLCLSFSRTARKLRLKSVFYSINYGGPLYWHICIVISNISLICYSLLNPPTFPPHIHLVKKKKKFSDNPKEHSKESCSYDVAVSVVRQRRLSGAQ